MVPQARVRRIVLAASLALGTVPAASAQDFFSTQLVPPNQEAFVLKLGGITNTFDTNLRLDGEDRRGTPINLEDNGLKDSLSSFEAGLLWRFAPNHRMGLQYYGTNRDGSRTYTDTITVGDNTYPVGATVSASNKNQIVNIDYRYSFINDPSFEMAGVFGLYGGTVKYDVTATGLVNGTSRSYSKSASVTVPIPVFGVTADWYLSPAWRIGGQIAGMKAKIGSIDGQAFVGGAHLDYQMWRGMGVGLKWSYGDIEADGTGDKLNGNFEYKTNAVSLYARFVF